MAPRVFVISGPSGAGKGTLVAEACSKRSLLDVAISCTTRLPREGEREGESYYFLSEQEFQKRKDAGDFLETAQVHGHHYGTLKKEVERIMACGSSVLLEIDVQGGLQIKEQMPDAVLIFVKAPSAAELEARLRGRASEAESDIKLRLSHAKAEQETAAAAYDEVMVNAALKDATNELLAIIEAYEARST